MIAFNQTKIVCTVGPATESKAMMKKMIEAGMDTMRLNFSHSSHPEHEARLTMLRELNQELGTYVAALVDTRGPEIRTHTFEGGQALIEVGQPVEVHMNEIVGSAERFSVTYPDLIKDIDVGGVIVVDDGYLSLKVERIDYTSNIIHTTSHNTHRVRDRRGINVPGIQLNLEYLSAKDEADIAWACEHDVDYLAASFVRRKEDVLAIRRLLDQCANTNIQIIAKIENREGVANIDEIIEVSDGVMIARGDLGVEVDAEDVPVIQKMIIKKVHHAGKISITATQMLESMQEHPRPTRAEVSDVANAILDGTDAVMLSGESAIGKYPVETVTMMHRIGKRLEKEMNREAFIVRDGVDNEDIANNIAISVAYAVLQGQADIVIAPTISGNTARLLSKNRPNTTILALVPDERKARSLMLHHGVFPKVVELGTDTEDLIKRSIALVKEEGFIRGKGRAIVTGGFPLGTATNSLRILDIT